MATPKRSTRNKPPLIDPALKARWQEALARYRHARDEETAGWDERYQALGEILDGDPPYYLAGGFKTARAFLAAEAPDQDERTVRMSIRVAQHFDPADEAAHGLAKLDALLTYLEAAGGLPLPPAKLHPDRQKIRVERNGAHRLVPFAEVTREELQAATRTARGQHASAKSPPAVVALRRALAKGGLRAISVQLRAGHFLLGNIAPEKLGQLGRALARVKLPA